MSTHNTSLRNEVIKAYDEFKKNDTAIGTFDFINTITTLYPDAFDLYHEYYQDEKWLVGKSYKTYGKPKSEKSLEQIMKEKGFDNITNTYKEIKFLDYKINNRDVLEKEFLANSPDRGMVRLFEP